MPSKESLGHVLVTGGCGMLGHHIVNMLLQRHPATRIAVLDLRTTDNRNPSPNVSYHDGDISDAVYVDSIFAKLKPDAVIHTASPNPHAARPLLDKVNIQGTKNLIKASQDNGVKAFVYTSSASVLCNWNTPPVNIDERWPLAIGKEQREYYTITKAKAEMAVLEANRTPSTFLTCAIRPAGIFGEGDVYTFQKFLQTYREGKTKFQIGQNDNIFDWTYVGNVAHSHLLALNALLATHALGKTVPLDTERVDGEAFIITNDSPCYFWDFTRAVWKEYGQQIKLNQIWVLSEDFALNIASIMEWVSWAMGKEPSLTRETAKYSCVNRYYCIDKAKRRLGYKPIIGLEDGIKRAAKWALEYEKTQAEKKAAKKTQ